MPIQIVKNKNTIAKLVNTSTSDTSKKLQRKPLTKYKTGFRSVTDCQNGGSTLTE